ncbi:hypothetical protein ACQKE4_04350 [Halomonas sp. NPDC076908]|uniref:hypothetical protein n=1 Tax=Halomonas sp. NPDC076908 TaxID=3390567 RepID=UPI003D07ECBF
MRDQLEKHQSWLYLSFIAMGLTLGIKTPGLSVIFEQWLWPLLGLLLYTTFTQIPLLDLARSVKDTRFMAALMVGNFIAIPAFWRLSFYGCRYLLLCWREFYWCY